MRTLTRPGLLALAAALAATPVLARADQPPLASELVVTASHFPQALQRPTLDATALSPSDAPAGATLGDLLSTVSDIEVQRPGGATGFGSIFVRGAKPNFTLVMIDGVPLNDQTDSRGGAADVSALDVRDVERVEVVRGALSSIYGSGAIEGAINLILPGGAAHPTAVATAEGGTDGDVSGGLLVRGPIAGGAGGSVGLDWADAGHAVEDSSRVNAALDAKLAPLDGSDRYGLTLRLSHTDADAFPDDSGGPRLAVLRTVEHRWGDDALLGAHWRAQLDHDLSLELNFAGSDDRSNDVTPGAAPGIGGPAGDPAGASRDRYDFARAQAIARLTPTGDWRVLAGVEAQNEQGHDQGFLDYFGAIYPSRYALDRTTLAAFAEADADHGPLSLDTSLRLDHPQGLGSHVTGGAGLAYRIVPALSLDISFGQSFKAPSFYSLGNSFVGNPALRPETSDTAEVGLRWNPAPGWRARASLFRIQYHQLIDFVPGPPPRLENLASVLSQGAQAELRAPLTARGELSLSATYIDTRDQSDGARLLDLPAWRATGALDWRLTARVRARLDVLYVGDRLDTSVPTGPVTLPPHASVDARVILAAGRGVQVEASLENALNARYEAAIGFPSPGVTGRLSVSRSF